MDIQHPVICAVASRLHFMGSLFYKEKKKPKSYFLCIKQGGCYYPEVAEKTEASAGFQGERPEICREESYLLD